jgi:predicted nucleic acid-binding protein
MPAIYLDASALVKLVVDESESSALRRFLQRRSPLVSSALSRTEVVRAVAAEGPEALARARAVILRIDLVRVNDRVLDAAGSLPPVELRSLDAIHIATAQQLGSDLGQLVTYDARMAAAAERLGMRTVAPA